MEEIIGLRLERCLSAGRVLLSAFDFSCPQGGLWALLGPTGCGKSTFLSCLAGLTPFDGELRWRGEPRRQWNGARAFASGLVLLPQQPALIPRLDVTDNLFLGTDQRPRWFRSRKRLVERAAALLEDRGVDLPATGVRCGDLSQGQQRMVALVKGALCRPSLLLLDEPMSGLGVAERLQFARLASRLKAEGVTLLCAFHRVEDALTLADGAWVMREGQVTGFFPAPLDGARLWNEMG